MRRRSHSQARDRQPVCTGLKLARAADASYPSPASAWGGWPAEGRSGGGVLASPSESWLAETPPTRRFAPPSPPAQLRCAGGREKKALRRGYFHDHGQVIGPTVKSRARRIRAGDCGLLCMGLFSIFRILALRPRRARSANPSVQPFREEHLTSVFRKSAVAVSTARLRQRRRNGHRHET